MNFLIRIHRIFYLVLKHILKMENLYLIPEQAACEAARSLLSLSKDLPSLFSLS